MAFKRLSRKWEIAQDALSSRHVTTHPECPVCTDGFTPGTSDNCYWCGGWHMLIQHCRPCHAYMIAFMKSMRSEDDQASTQTCEVPDGQ